MKGIAIIVGSMASLALLAGCHKPPAKPVEQTLPAVAVSTRTIEAKTHVAMEEVVGTVQSRLRATISPKVSGRVETLLVTPGQSVKKGDMLAQIDARDIQARLDQANAVKMQAEIELKRVNELAKAGTLSQAELDLAKMRAGVAEANVKEVETLLSFARVVAPFDGLIIRKIADVGDLAAPGQPLLDMEDPKVLRLEADVPEALIGRVKLGDQLAVRLASIQQELEGIVSEVEPVANPNSRTLKAKLDLPAVPGLRSGVFGRVAVPVGETTTLRVPAKALVVRGQMEIVFVIANQKAQLRLVKTGKHFADEIELVSGVRAGEMVAVEGAAQLADGQPVTIKP
jgi:RND family efflux transporter MFP subunit